MKTPNSLNGVRLFVLAAICGLLSGCFGCDKSGQSTGSPDLPPDPGPAGKNSLAGIDSDDDGVRDDVQRFILLNNYDDSTQTALISMAKSSQNLILAAENEDDALAAAEEISKSIYCLMYLDEATAHEKIASLKAALLNTEQRFDANAKAQQLLSGSTFRIPPIETWGDGCTP